MAVVVAQLVERSFPTPEIHATNPDISEILSTNCPTEKIRKIKEKEAGSGPSFKKSVHYLNYKSGYRISGTIKLKESKPSLFPRLKPFRHKTLCCYLLHSNKTASFFVSDVQINPGENFSGGFKTEIFRPIHLEDKLEAGALMDQPVNPIN